MYGTFVRFYFKFISWFDYSQKIFMQKNKNNVLSDRKKDKILLNIKGRNNNILQIKFSSLYMDTDISAQSNLAMVIKYHPEISNTVNRKLLNLVEVKDESAKGLFTTLSTEISKSNLEM